MKNRMKNIPDTDHMIGDPCVYCGGDPEFLDHVDADLDQTEHTNLVPVCRSCNSSKNDLSLLLFLLYRRARAADDRHQVRRIRGRNYRLADRLVDELAVVR